MNTQSLAKERYISITTFRRDGTPVSTPVWCAGDNGSLLVFSEADSGKVKRIRHNRHVRVAPCNARGKPYSEAVDGDATIVEETEKVEALLASKYGWLWPAYNLFMAVARCIRRKQAPRAVTIGITLR
jgi:PPOX class probable F420-dependent enzyme